jgi:hypothetical protein
VYLLNNYVPLDVNGVEMLIKEQYAEEVEKVFNDIVMLSNLSEDIKIIGDNEQKQFKHFYGYEIFIKDKGSLRFYFYNNDTFMFSDKEISKKKIDGLYCIYDDRFKKHFNFKGDYSIKYEKENSSIETVNLLSIISILNRIRDLVI